MSRKSIDYFSLSDEQKKLVLNNIVKPQKNDVPTDPLTIYSRYVNHFHF